MTKIVGYSGNNPIRDNEIGGYGFYGPYWSDVTSGDRGAPIRVTIQGRRGFLGCTQIAEAAQDSDPPDPEPPTSFDVDGFLFTDDVTGAVITEVSEEPNQIRLAFSDSGDISIGVGDVVLVTKEFMSGVDQPLYSGVYEVIGYEGISPMTLARIETMRVGDAYTWADIDSPQGETGTLYRARISNDGGVIGSDALAFDFFLVPA